MTNYKQVKPEDIGDLLDCQEMEISYRTWAINGYGWGTGPYDKNGYLQKLRCAINPVGKCTDCKYYKQKKGLDIKNPRAHPLHSPSPPLEQRDLGDMIREGQHDRRDSDDYQQTPDVIIYGPSIFSDISKIRASKPGMPGTQGEPNKGLSVERQERIAEIAELMSTSSRLATRLQSITIDSVPWTVINAEECPKWDVAAEGEEDYQGIWCPQTDNPERMYPPMDE